LADAVGIAGSFAGATIGAGGSGEHREERCGQEKPGAIGHR